jgi:hypothetical protein
MAPKKDPKITSPIKPPESSSMTHEENEEIQNQLSKLNSQINELNDRSMKKVDLMNTQNRNGKKDGCK